MRTLIPSLAAVVLAAGFALASAAVSAQSSAEMKTVELMAADKSGTPEGIAKEEWMKASGEARVVSRENNQDMIEIEAEGLVPGGLYTTWWVTPSMLGMDMGPGGGTPANEFRADDQGNVKTTLNVPSENTYGMMVIAYHADDQTHGEKPGEMGKQTFEQLMGAWPGPEGKMADM
jgi:hypothetical protein